MATQINSIQWSKTLPLDRTKSPLVFERLLSQKSYTNFIKEDVTRSSLIYSAKLRENLEQSRKAFLNLFNETDENVTTKTTNNTKTTSQDDTNKENIYQEQRKLPTKKISFKIKKTSSIYKRTPKLTANNVAQLTNKFNNLLNEHKSVLEKPSIAKLVRQVNNYSEKENINKVIRKPSVKIKPDDKGTYVIKKLSVKRKVSVQRMSKKEYQSDKTCVRAKISYLESPQNVNKTDQFHFNKEIFVPKSMPSGTVRAAIEIFEKRNSYESPKTIINEPKMIIREKPEVPVKNFSQQQRMLLMKNAERNAKILEKRKDNFCNNQEMEKTETDLVQIINIPLSPPRKCESNYETVRKISPPTYQIPLRNAPLIIPSVDDHEPNTTEVLNDYKPNNSFLWRKSSLHREALNSSSTSLENEPNGRESISLLDQVNNNTPLDQTDDSDCNIIKMKDEEVADEEDWEALYDRVDATIGQIAEECIKPEIKETPPSSVKEPVNVLPLPPKKVHKRKLSLPKDVDDKASTVSSNDNNYEICDYEEVGRKSDDGYEYCTTNPSEMIKENVYETLPAIRKPPISVRPLPPRPQSRDSYCTIKNDDDNSATYETIYISGTNGNNKIQDDSNYETINVYNKSWSTASNRDSIVSSEQQSNSLYGRSIRSWAVEDVCNTYSGKATSDLSDRSDEWIDISDNEDNKGNSIRVRERHKQVKKPLGWSQQVREQWNKSPRKFVFDQDDDPSHHYETLYPEQEESHDEDFDSFDNDSDCEENNTKTNSRVDIRQNQLPEPPGNQTYVLTSIAELAGKQMRKLRRNWSLTKNDITKSLSRITKKKSRAELSNIAPQRETQEKRLNECQVPPRPTSLFVTGNSKYVDSNSSQDSYSPTNSVYQNMQFNNETNQESPTDKNKNTIRKGFLNKFRRSMSLSNESNVSENNQNSNKTQSTFYVTNTINIDGNNKEKTKNSPKIYKKTPIVRPQNPPPPAPQNVEIVKREKATSWYTECGLFKNTEIRTNRPNSYWYAEVGLYQTNNSTPSTSSAENSGTNTNLNIKTNNLDNINIENGDEYYNMKNDHYCNHSLSSSSSETKINQSSIYGSNDMHLRLEEEPLYQFYDAARVDSICGEGSSEFDSDGYEEVGNRSSIISNRPTAMELISPKSNAHARTLWSEIPEVINSAVLSTLSSQQKKLQEAKFEMLTSEASYLKSLNVLTNYFVKNINTCEFLTYQEKDILFGKINLVKNCSEKLLQDLEHCWQDNILLHGVCDIIREHAEENFDAYIRYCENQILLEGTLRNLKDKTGFNDYIKQLENSTSCQSLSLYSFLMIPMQRITRWPLLVDAVLKRLSPQDSEYISCQYALATLNKIVTQCNEAARQMERKVEMQKIQSQIEFDKNIKPIPLIKDSRWLVRSGQVTQMLNRGDDVKLTFGKRFTKVPLMLFLFNDILLICKTKCDDQYVVIHHCSRSMIEISLDGVFTLSSKDVQNRNMIFVTILENQEQKTVELLLSCYSESDRERWMEALLPPKSDNPDETLYERWDCPQVTAIHNYTASQPDELPLSRGDIINVTRKMVDGWYHGERIRDGLMGWFPANYTVEVVNPHLRARNLKQRYRLLAFSENYLKSK